MINIEKEKQQIINRINKEIEINKKRIEFIENLKIEPINAEKFEQIINEIEILDNKTILLEILKATFPNSTNWYFTFDAVYFELNNIKFYIYFNSPIIHTSNILLIKPYSFDKKPVLGNYRKKVINLSKLIHSNPKDWYNIQCALKDTDIKPFKKIRYFLDWIFYRKYKISKYLTKIDLFVEKWEENYKSNIKHYYETKRETFKDIKKFKEILPILEQFGDIDIDKEVILNFKEEINGKPFIRMKDIKEFKNQYHEYIKKIE